MTVCTAESALILIKCTESRSWWMLKHKLVSNQSGSGFAVRPTMQEEESYESVLYSVEKVKTLQLYNPSK